MNVRLETERLILRPFRPEDREAVLEFASNPQTQEHTGDPLRKDLNEIDQLIENIWLKDYNTHGYGRFALIHKADNKIIGFSGIKYLPEADATDLGYRMLPEYWGKGLATESCRPVLDFAFNQIGLEEVIAFVEAANPASSRVLEKLGFTYVKTAHYPGETETEPVLWYELTKNRYERQ